MELSLDRPRTVQTALGNYEPFNERPTSSHTYEGKHAVCPAPTLEATQGQILSQAATDATRFWWHLYGS